MFCRCENKDCAGKQTTDEVFNVRNPHSHFHEPNLEMCEAKRLRSEALVLVVRDLSKASNEVKLIKYFYFDLL